MGSNVPPCQVSHICKPGSNIIKTHETTSLQSFREISCTELPDFYSNEYYTTDERKISPNEEFEANRKNSMFENKRLRSTHVEKSIKAKKHVIKMLFIVVLEFFICWSPIFIVNTLYLYIPQQVYDIFGSFGISLLHLLSYASSCCNPITYCFMNRRFLQGFRNAFGCKSMNERYNKHVSFRSHSNNIFKIQIDLKNDMKETSV